MIRLTLNASTSPEVFLFNKLDLLIGSDPSQADLILKDSKIQPIHLQIIYQNGIPYILNRANDPFVSLNNHPFGKRKLESGNLITLHQTTLLFEILAEYQEPNNLLTPSNPENNSSINSSDELPLSSFTLPFEQEVEVLKEEELSSSSLNKYLNDLEKAPSKNKSEKKRSRSSLKDDYLKELDDDNHRRGSGPFGLLMDRSHLYKATKWFFIILSCLLIFSALVGTILYFSMSDKSEAHETKAIQGTADLAMALTHAQLNLSQHQNQNWSDADFLKTHLQMILPETSSFASSIDSQGQLNCCPYSVRIYTDTNLSHYLLIAQPAPHFLNWLIPQSLIVVDSHLMELRKLSDVRTLNRLLTNPEPFEGINGKEITALVKQGELIRLADLAAHANNLEFLPPKNLEWLKPGAENLIYNAPRYFHLGQNIVHRAINLATSKGSSHEVTALKQDVQNFTTLNNAVLYSDQGQKSALIIKQGLTIFAPSDKLLVGYLLFNSQGKLHQVHLLKDDEPKDIIPEIKNESEIIAYEPSVEETPKEINESSSSQIDKNHPIYIQLHALVKARENEIKPLILALNTLVNQELQNPRAQFQVEFQNLSHSYLMANAKHKKELKTNLETLFHQYEDLPINQFLSYIKDLQLEQLIQQDGNKLSTADENCEQNMETLLTHIENSKSLEELNHIVHIAVSWLNFDYIKDPTDLVKYQNLLRNQLLEKLEKYLLSQKQVHEFKLDDKEILLDILNHERLIKSEEKEFFLEEFESIITSSKPEIDSNNIN